MPAPPTRCHSSGHPEAFWPITEVGRCLSQARTGFRGPWVAVRAISLSSTSATSKLMVMTAAECSTSTTRTCRATGSSAPHSARAHAATTCPPESLLPPQASRGRRGQRGYTWKSYGPFCAQEGWHNFTYTSDGNPEETVFTITDSYGLIKAQGGMHDLPVRFYTYAPSKFCVPDEGLTGDQSNKRNNKLFAYHDQFTPRAKLIEEGFGAPQDKWPPLTVFDNEDFTKNVRSWATV